MYYKTSDNKLFFEPSNSVIAKYNLTQITKEEFDGILNVPKTLEQAMAELRQKRNSLLAQTDYLALSDQTLSAEMTTYRQALRDITNGLTTVADVEAVVFPEKPEV